METIISILAFLLIPIGWGLGSAWLFEWLRDRHQKANGEKDDAE